MSDIQILVDMGFSRDNATRALEVTNNKGVEPAMEWLLAHADEDISNSIKQSDVETKEENPTPQESIDKNPQTAKSIKCNDCGKLFKSQSDVEYHAAKTNHTNFAESTEEKKPLTEEEKKAQLALIEQKLREKRAERAERERIDNLEREKSRIKSGKDMTEAKRRMEELEMKKIIDQRKREKEEEKAARERVKAQIEADKAARKAKLNPTGVIDQPIQSPATSSTTVAASKNNKEYTNTKIQIRLKDGSTLTETFAIKEQLSAVRVFIQMKINDDVPFGLMTSFPRKVFSDEDYEKPLDALGLVPSAVLIVTKAM